MHFRWSGSRARYVALVCLVLGVLSCGVGAISSVLSRNLFDSVMFGRHAADSLSDPGVAAYTADLISDGVIRRKPDLIAFRPVLVSVTESLVSNQVFRSVVERAAQRAHQAA